MPKRQRVGKQEATSAPAIAVIGMAAWYPGARDLQQFWENVLAKRRQFRRFPDQRLPLADYYDPAPRAPDKTYATRAAFIDGFEFDWAMRRMPQKTYESTDVVHWLALEVALKALDDAGYTPETIPTPRSAALVGNSLTGEQTRSRYMRLRWPFVRRALRAASEARGLPPELVAELEETMEEYYKSVFPPVTEDTLAGVLSNTIAGRICNFLDFQGGGYTVDGACASGMIAVATAASQLTHGDIDFALAGGVDVSLDAMEMIGFAKVGALTREDMNVYDKRGSGFLPGEGCGFVALKRLADARADGDYVYAVIRGWGISTDGRGGITAPRADSQAEMLRRAYGRAGYSSHEIAFVEGHGTGTVAGDKAELEGIQLALSTDGEPAPRSIGMTSFKSLIGHTKAASGIGGLIKAVMAVNRRVLPPFAGCSEPNQTFNRVAHALYPILHGELRDPGETIRAGASAMGFGGINVHVAIESGDAPSPKLEPSIDERTLMASHQETELFVLTAGSLDDLRRRAEELREVAVWMSVAELTDLAAQVARDADPAAPLRAALVAGLPTELVERLEQLVAMLGENPPPEGEVVVAPRRDVAIGNRVREARVGFLFPGQGSQQLEMARVLVDRFAWARELLEQADAWLREAGSEPVSELIYRPLDRAQGRAQVEEWAEALAQTEVAQPAICLASLLWLRYLERLGLKPAVVAGHSLGELTAFHAAGAFDERTLIALAALRGRAMAAAGDEAGTMASLACSREQAEELAGRANGYVVVANINSPTQVVVSGERAAVEEVTQLAEAEEIQFRLLPVSNAFHSKLVAAAAERLREEAPVPETLGETAVPVYSGVDAQPVPAGADLRAHFGNQVVAQVDFISLVERLAQDCDLFVEVGPGRVLSGLVNAITGGAPSCLPVASEPGADRDLNMALASLFARGAELAWDELYAGRLVRPFVPASELLFIENPVELPFQVEGPIAPSVSVGTGGGALAPLLDLPGPLLADYLARRGSFIADVIRADLATAPASAAAPAPTPAPAPVAQAADGAGRSIEARLAQLAAELTGFPAETITGDVRLLDDLNLDSIKAGELVATAAQEYGVADKLDPAELGNATLQAVAEAIRAVLPAGAAAGDGRGADSAAAIQARLVALAADLTGFPAETITQDVRLLDDLNLDSIKAGELVAAAAQEFGVADKLDPSELGNATLEDVTAAIRAALGGAAPGGDGAGPAVPELLLGIIARATGFPPESLTLDLRLLDDLNLDSIKAAEVVGEAATALGVQDALDPAVLGNATLAEVVEALQNARGDAAGARPAGPPAQAVDEFAERPSWVRNFVVEHLPADTPADPADLTDASALLVAEPGEADLTDAIGAAFGGRGAEVRTASFAEAPGLVEGDSFTHLVAVLPRTSEGSPEEAVQRSVERLRAVAAAPAGTKAVAYVQFGAGYEGTRPPVAGIEQCCAAAFAAGLHHERGELTVRAVDVAPAIKPAALAERLLAELATPEPFAVACYDAKLVRRVPTPRVQDPGSEYERRPIAWSAEDVFLVTGGAKGITAECALALASATGARMALAGSSPAPEGPAEDNEIAGTLERFRSAGLTARYFQCDIGDGGAVEGLVARVREELGPITGVVHGAGANTPRRVEQVTVEAARAEVTPKVLGALHLARALADAPPKLIVGFTSIIGVTGMPGNTWYGFANQALDLTLRRFAAEHPETAVCSMAFSVWGEVGMGAKLGSAQHLAKMGVAAIPTDEGVRRFLELVENDPGERQVVIAARLRGLDTWRPALPAPPTARRFVDDVLHLEPGVELVARAQLTLDRDPYLEDHVYNGSFLLPTVFGLEAMAQAAAYAAGESELGPLRIEDVWLERPIVVDPARGAQIEVRAEVLEREPGSAERRVRASIGVESTGFARDHFSAVFVLGVETEAPTERVELPEAPLDVDPQQDLYSWLLFQGPRFQRLRRIHSLDERRCVFTAETRPDPEGGPFLLGDPYVRDSLLQAPQVIVPQDICLPYSIASIELYRLDGQAGERLSVGIKELQDEKQIEGQVFAVDEEGRVVERLSGYRARILEHRDDNPTADEIADPGARDDELLRRELASRAETLGVTTPEVALAYLPGMHALSREERHERELPLFAETVSRYLKNGGGAA